MQVTDLGGRLKAWRVEARLTQDRLAQETGVPLQSIKGYESGTRLPGAEALAGIASTGANINWLLTGEGPMRAVAAGAPADLSDNARLQATIEAVEEGLRSINRKLPPDKYAELVAVAYTLMDPVSPAGSRVVQFIKAAA